MALFQKHQAKRVYHQESDPKKPANAGFFVP